MSLVLNIDVVTERNIYNVLEISKLLRQFSPSLPNTFTIIYFKNNLIINNDYQILKKNLQKKLFRYGGFYIKLKTPH